MGRPLGLGSFQWDLFSIDCTAPVVDFSVVNDCANNQFFIEVDITDLGNANTVDITQHGGAPDVLGAGLGISQVGPSLGRAREPHGGAR